MRRHRRSHDGVWVELRLDENGQPFVLFEPHVTAAEEEFAAAWIRAASQQQTTNLLPPGRHFTDEQINEIGRELDKRRARAAAGATHHHHV